MNGLPSKKRFRAVGGLELIGTLHSTTELKPDQSVMSQVHKRLV